MEVGPPSRSAPVGQGCGKDAKRGRETRDVRVMDDLFRQVPRKHFLPREVRDRAAEDAPVPIGHGQTNSQPSTVRTMLDLLEVRTGHRVLDVGCGSGWTTALLHRLAGPEGRVLAVERVPELVAEARRNTAAYGLDADCILQAEPGVLGAPGEAPFDRILVSAMAGRAPGELFGQLAPGGVLVGPWNGMMHRVRRLGGGQGESLELEITTHGRYSFVPLIG